MTGTKLEALWLEMEQAKTAYFTAKDAYEAELVASYPFRVGDVIKNNAGELSKVTSIFIRYDKVVMTAVKQLNDGRFGKAVVPFWKGQWNDAVLYERPPPP